MFEVGKYYQFFFRRVKYVGFIDGYHKFTQDNGADILISPSKTNLIYSDFKR